MDVIDLAKVRAAREAGKPFERGEWLFNMSVFAPPHGAVDPQYSGFMPECADSELTDTQHMRMAADALENIAWILRDMAHDQEPDADGRVLSRTTIYESSRVRTWISSDIQSGEQKQWMIDRLDDAKKNVAE